MRGSSRTELLPVAMVVVLVGAMFVVFAAAVAGLWAWFLAGAWLFFGIVYAAVRLVRAEEHPAADDVPHVHPASDPGRYNVLVLAGEACGPDAIRRHVVQRAERRQTCAFVIAPAVSSTRDRLTGDEAAYERARRRLQETLAALEPVSVSRNGKIGSHDPVQAIDEALREFPSDEILLAHHPAREKRHGRAAVVDICRERYDIPVTAVPDEHAVDEPSLPRS